jgi:hypothetical protein
MMDVELSKRLAWYANFIYAADDTAAQEMYRDYKLTALGRDAGTFNNLPDYLKSQIIEAEGSYNPKLYPQMREPYNYGESGV